VSFHATIRIRKATGEGQLNDKHVIKALERLASLHEAKGDVTSAIETLNAVLSVQTMSLEFDEVNRWKKLGVTQRSIAELYLSINQLGQAVHATRESIEHIRLVVQHVKSLQLTSSTDTSDVIAVVEQLVSSLLLMASLYQEMYEPLKANDVLADAAAITHQLTLELEQHDAFLRPASLSAMLEVTSMLAGGCCAPQA
jgi:hypothetical protein